MHIDNGFPIVLTHLVEHAIAQDPSGVDDPVQTTKRVFGLLDHALDRRHIGHAFRVRSSLSASVSDLLRDLFGQTRIAGGTAIIGERAAKIVDDNFGAFETAWIF